MLINSLLLSFYTFYNAFRYHYNEKKYNLKMVASKGMAFML